MIMIGTGARGLHSDTALHRNRAKLKNASPSKQGHHLAHGLKLCESIFVQLLQPRPKLTQQNFGFGY